MRDEFGVAQPQGELSFSGRYDFVYREAKAALTASGVNAELSGLRLALEGATEPLVALRSISIGDASLVLGTRELVVRSLRIDAGKVRAVEWADNGPGWVAVLLDSADEVLALDPDFDAMGDQPVGVVGPFGPGGEPATGADVEVRAFVPGIGVPEDPVTGSLAGGLGIWLPTTGVVGDDFVIRQGTALGRRGIVRVTREDGSVWVGGDTVLAVAGDVALGSPGRSSGTR